MGKNALSVYRPVLFPGPDPSPLNQSRILRSRKLCSKGYPWSEALAGCEAWDLISLISLRLRHIDSSLAEVKSGRTFVTMILQEFVFGLVAF